MFALVLPFVLANWRAAALVGAVVAIVSAGAIYRHALIMQGEATALEKVEAANAANRERANAASEAVSRCGASGGVWNRATGLCDHPAGQ